MAAQLRGDFTKLNKLIKTVGKLGTPALLKSVASALGADAVELIQQGFEAGHSPQGASWAPLKRRAGQPLRDTGRLQRSLTQARSSAAGFKIGTNVSYAAYHQHGTSRTTARPFLPQDSIPGSWVRIFEQTAESMLTQALGFAAE